MALTKLHPGTSVPGAVSAAEYAGRGRENAARARALLWYAFGGLWLLDGLLQLQHPMFTSVFVQGVLAPAAAGQPVWLTRVMESGILLWNRAPQLWNLGAAAVQILFGLFFLFRSWHRWRRAALWMSMGWSVFVWVFAEGLGGLLNGTGNWFMGGPGSSLLYAVAAATLLLPLEVWQDGHVKRWLEWVLAGMALVGAIYQCLPTRWTPVGVAELFGPYGGSVGDWVRSALSQHALIANDGFVTLLVILALGWYRGVTGRLWYFFTGTVLLFIWAFGQNFGILGGLGTDPNTIPPLAALLVATYWAPGPSSNVRGAFPHPWKWMPSNTSSAVRPSRNTPRPSVPKNGRRP